MNLPKRLVLIRHAESERNKALDGALFLNDPTVFEQIGKIPDHKIGITDAGIKQAQQVAEKISKLFQPDIVFHSGYKRTKDTAEHILGKYEKGSYVLKEDLSIRERESGYTHTLMQEDNEKHFPYLQDYWNIVGGLFARPIGGESLIDVVEKRLKPFLKDIFEKYPDKTIFLVTHGRVITCLRFILDEMTWDEMEKFLDDKEGTPKNCGVSIYEADKVEGKMICKTWNEVWWE